MEIDWNAVEALGTWFAGVATAGSLWLGFLILRKDRRRAEREQAAKIAFFSQTSRTASEMQRAIAAGVSKDGTDIGFRFEVRVWNHSDRPIFNVVLNRTGSDEVEAFVTDSQKFPPDPAILPGGYAAVELEGVAPEIIMEEYVTFTDASGVDWAYLLFTRDLCQMKYKAVRYRARGGNRTWRSSTKLVR